MKKITYLGPTMATFSALAYEKLAELFGAPRLNDGEESLVKTNEEVLPLVIGHGGYGAIAMETIAEGRVEGPVNSFLQLLGRYQKTEDCPTTAIGAIEMPINFALMARKGIALADARAIVGHIKSFGACKKKIQALGVSFVESPSNGQAAEDVATKPEFAMAVALGPKVAAEKYGLQVLEEAYEDEPAVTTFFLLGARAHSIKISEFNRSLFVCRFKNEPGALAKVIVPFADAGINIRHVRDYYTGNSQYDFVFQFDCRKDQIELHARAMEMATKHMERYILFGPFPVL